MNKNLFLKICLSAFFILLFQSANLNAVTLGNFGLIGSSPGTYKPGDALSASVSIQGGPVSPSTRTFNVSVYLSPTNQVGGSFLGSISASIPPNEFSGSIFSKSFTVPSSTIAGNYFVVFSVDGDVGSSNAVILALEPASLDFSSRTGSSDSLIISNNSSATIDQSGNFPPDQDIFFLWKVSNSGETSSSSANSVVFEINGQSVETPLPAIGVGIAVNGTSAASPQNLVPGTNTIRLTITGTDTGIINVINDTFFVQGSDLIPTFGIVSASTLEGTEFEEGETLTVGYGAENTGEVATSLVFANQIQIIDLDTNETVAFEQNDVTVVVNPNQEEFVVRNLPALPPGEYEATVIVDIFSEIAETSEINNTESLVFTVLPLDSDDDGIPDTYESANGLNPDNNADATLDLDNDGTPNFAEFELDLDPQDPAEKISIALDPSDLSTLTISPVGPGVSFNVQSSTNLTTWDPLEDGIHEFDSKSNSGDIVLPQGASGQQFYRIFASPTQE